MLWIVKGKTPFQSNKSLEINKNTMFVAKIHNNSLGNCIAIESYEEGKELIRKMAVEQFGRELTNEELEQIENDMELYNDDDADNVYTFAIGSAE